MQLVGVLTQPVPFPVDMRIVAVVLPWLELLCGLALFANVWPESVLTLAAALFVVYILATGQAWARGLDISCGCFSLKTIGPRNRRAAATSRRS